ncbi:protein phosphatase 1 regulatory subunit 3C [Notolabrus celidotus]|uniref:protein phosphatase 1 regulatory subunit 3C n=1 Tax=Notolabrus celidotus TaxID=1203425 RepID=UPI001490377E|nr:protein phosphatase 1 regulatory subunit 3C [Notolabrus celidotus]XP_034565622.1 protein phosphatase 1 regulatory subunit 3C [Notolabrus celidotus]XP_034565623.1 protein phosphatase 1 regulatory subunit 3C [Notolabrus celidotus]XP_034565624.1 protein phosphatase 1 regulatory subunit 3C [Notolabrus celidotus]
MTCTRVLSALGSHAQPAMTPVDLAMHLRLSQRQPLYELLSMSPLKPAEQSSQPAQCLQRAISLRSTRRSPSSPHSLPSLLPSAPVAIGPQSCFRRDSSGRTKKRVVFADAKGLALTAVRLFIPDYSIPTSTLPVKPTKAKVQSPQWSWNKLLQKSPSSKLQQQSTLNILQQQSSPNQLQHYKLRLGFPQPVLDISLARLREMRVQLESCNISGNSLSGRVRVSHVSTEKAVHVRMTFDSWQSHHDIPCTFLQEQRFGSSVVDVFAFDLSLPKNVDPEERIEFCVSLRTGAATHWDDNNGQNYRVCVEKDRANANQGNTNSSYSTLTKYQPPSWPSYVSLSVQNYADPQYIQNSLSRRFNADWDPEF